MPNLHEETKYSSNAGEWIVQQCIGNRIIIRNQDNRSILAVQQLPISNPNIRRPSFDNTACRPSFNDTSNKSPFQTQESSVGTISNASCAGFLIILHTDLIGCRAKKRLFILTQTRLMYFKSNSVTSNLLVSIVIESRTVITFPKERMRCSRHGLMIT
jgi:hypothetical protein